MKKNTHPQYHTSATAVCSCGNTIEIGSTKEKIDIEICSACHPFFSGKQKLVDSAGRIEKFNKLAEKVAALKGKKATKKARKTNKKSTEA